VLVLPVILDTRPHDSRPEYRDTMVDMGKRTAIPQFRLLLLVLMFGTVVSQLVWADELSAPKSLWYAVHSSPPAGQAPTVRKPWIIRDREIALDLPLLHILKDAGARPIPRITVELFDSAAPELDVSSTVSRINGTAVIRGTLKPPVQGDFTFVITGNILIGTIQLGDRLYKTDHIANGRLRLVELDPDKMPRD
jgi:hypothetical protein